VPESSFRLGGGGKKIIIFKISIPITDDVNKNILLELLSEFGRDFKDFVNQFRLVGIDVEYGGLDRVSDICAIKPRS
jgi:hypothetical protein